MNLFARLNKLPRRQLAIGLTILVVFVLALTIFLGALLTGKIKFQAESPPVVNTATATYQDAGGNSINIQSNTVTTQIGSGSTPPSEYGQLLEGAGRANFDWWRQYPSQTIRFAASFVAPKTGTITQVSIPMRTDAGYGGGNYGIYTFELFTNNSADNFPSTTSLAQVTNVSPSAAMGGGTDGPAFVALSANLQAGQIYHLVITNTDSSPATNYASVNTLMSRVFPWDGGVAFGARSAVFKDGIWRGWTSGDASNFFNAGGSNYTNGGHVALMLKWSDNSYTGDSFWSAAFGSGAFATFCGSNKFGEHIVWRGSDVTINKVGLPLLKTGSPADITYHFERATGESLATGTIAAAQFTSTSTPTWGYADLTSPVTLVNGSTYRLWFESTASACATDYYELHPVYAPGSPTTWFEGTWGGSESSFTKGITGGWTVTRTQDFIFSIQGTTSTNPSANIDVALQGRTNLAGSNIRLTVYQAGTTTKVFEKTDITTDAGGNANVAVTGLTIGSNYDFQLKVPYFLSQKITNQVFSDNMTIAFSNLRAGDLDNSNLVNSLDYSVLNGKWDQADPIADINQDGLVNTIDFSLLNSNWFQSGQ